MLSLNLNDISHALGLPLSLQGGDVVVDAVLPSLKEAMAVGLKTALLLPPLTVILLRYWNAGMSIEFPYSLRETWINRIKGQPQNGAGSMGQQTETP